MDTLTISLAQFTIQQGEPDRNVERVKQLVDQAAGEGSGLILLPELWSTGFDLENKARHAAFNRDLLPEIQRWADDHSLYIGGSYLLERDGAFYNQFVLTGPGGFRCDYAKIHLFRLMHEEQHFAAGDRLALARLPRITTGLAVCYDLRFPEMFRQLAVKGAELILLSGEWPERRIEHWQALVKARAIENQVFFAAVNTTGMVGGTDFGGQSSLISPWGKTVLDAGRQEGLFTARIDPGEVAHARKTIPVLSDRRPDSYRFFA
ncbi:MAG TPA: carbon-nitrogen family hydrolase [Anaerolineaceae bacterium]|nr:carbon-nitrogen family hydrolase [Anaerolineaceae bacterium]